MPSEKKEKQLETVRHDAEALEQFLQALRVDPTEREDE